MAKTNIKKVKELNLRLLFDRMIITADTIDVTKSGVILNRGKGKTLAKQKVIFAGPAADIKPGEEIELNLNRFPVKKMTPKHEIGDDVPIEVMFPIETLNGEHCMLITTQEIKFIYGNLEK